ncbi:MAG: preprotein translocase subunit SecA, partial [Candidatus Omnitrophota bacterium]
MIKITHPKSLYLIISLYIRHIILRVRSLKPIKMMAWLLILAFSLQQMSQAAYGVTQATINVEGQIASPLIDLGIADSIGRVVDSYQARGQASQKTIILIEDAHANYSGQMNIAKVLESIQQAKQTSLVLLEGAAGDMSLSELRHGVSLQKRQVIGNKYVHQGLMQGSEYHDLVSADSVELVGVEDMGLYDQSLEHYKQAMSKRDTYTNYIKRVQSTTEFLKNKAYNALLLEFDNLQQAYNAESTSIIQYANAIKGLIQKYNLKHSNYNSLNALNTLQDLEHKIDFEIVNQEYAELLQQAGELEVSAESINSLHKNSTATKSHAAQFELLNTMLQAQEDAGVDMKFIYSHLAQYLKYLNVIKDLNMNTVLIDIDALTQEIYMQLMQSSQERTLKTISAQLDVLANLGQLSIQSTNHQSILQSEETYQLDHIVGQLNQVIFDSKDYQEKILFTNDESKECLQSILNFYALTHERDLALIHNSLRYMDNYQKDTAVLIAGGFHTSNLKLLLRQNDISYMVVTPAVLHATNHAKYEELLLSQQVPNERLNAILNTASMSLPAIRMNRTKLTYPKLANDLGSTTIEVTGVPEAVESSRLSQKELEAAVEADILDQAKQILVVLQPGDTKLEDDEVWDALLEYVEWYPADNESDEKFELSDLSEYIDDFKSTWNGPKLALLFLVLNDQRLKLKEIEAEFIEYVQKTILPDMRRANSIIAYTMRDVHFWRQIPTYSSLDDEIFIRKLDTYAGTMSPLEKSYRLALFGYHLRVDYQKGDILDLNEISKLAPDVINEIKRLRSKGRGKIDPTIITLSKNLVNGLNIDLSEQKQGRLRTPLRRILSLIKRFDVDDAEETILYAYEVLEHAGNLTPGNDSFLTAYTQQDAYTENLIDSLNEFNSKRSRSQRVSVASFLTNPQAAQAYLDFYFDKFDIDIAAHNRLIKRNRRHYLALRKALQKPSTNVNTPGVLKNGESSRLSKRIELEKIVEESISFEGRTILRILNPNYNPKRDSEVWDSLDQFALSYDAGDVGGSRFELSQLSSIRVEPHIYNSQKLTLLFMLMNDQAANLGKYRAEFLRRMQKIILPQMRRANYSIAYAMRDISFWKQLPTYMVAKYGKYEQRLNNYIDDMDILEGSYRLALFGYHLRSDYAGRGDRGDIYAIKKIAPLVIDEIQRLRNTGLDYTHPHIIILSKNLINGLNLDLNTTEKKVGNFKTSIDALLKEIKGFDSGNSIDVILYAFDVLEKNGYLSPDNDDFLTAYSPSDAFTSELMGRLTQYNESLPRSKRVSATEFLADPEVAQAFMKFHLKQEGVGSAHSKRLISRNRKHYFALRAALQKASTDSNTPGVLKNGEGSRMVRDNYDLNPDMGFIDSVLGRRGDILDRANSPSSADKSFRLHVNYAMDKLLDARKDFVDQGDEFGQIAKTGLGYLMVVEDGAEQLKLMGDEYFDLMSAFLQFIPAQQEIDASKKYRGNDVYTEPWWPWSLALSTNGGYEAIHELGRFLESVGDIQFRESSNARGNQHWWVAFQEILLEAIYLAQTPVQADVDEKRRILNEALNYDSAHVRNLAGYMLNQELSHQRRDMRDYRILHAYVVARKENEANDYTDAININKQDLIWNQELTNSYTPGVLKHGERSRMSVAAAWRVIQADADMFANIKATVISEERLEDVYISQKYIDKNMAVFTVNVLWGLVSIIPYAMGAILPNLLINQVWVLSLVSLFISAAQMLMNIAIAKFDVSGKWGDTKSRWLTIGLIPILEAAAFIQLIFSQHDVEHDSSPIVGAMLIVFVLWFIRFAVMAVEVDNIKDPIDIDLDSKFNEINPSIAVIVHDNSFGKYAATLPEDSFGRKFYGNSATDHIAYLVIDETEVIEQKRKIERLVSEGGLTSTQAKKIADKVMTFEHYADTKLGSRMTKGLIRGYDAQSGGIRVDISKRVRTYAERKKDFERYQVVRALNHHVSDGQRLTKAAQELGIKTSLLVTYVKEMDIDLNNTRLNRPSSIRIPVDMDEFERANILAAMIVVRGDIELAAQLLDIPITELTSAAQSYHINLVALHPMQEGKAEYILKTAFNAREWKLWTAISGQTNTLSKKTTNLDGDINNLSLDKNAGQLVKLRTKAALIEAYQEEQYRELSDEELLSKHRDLVQRAKLVSLDKILIEAMALFGEVARRLVDTNPTREQWMAAIAIHQGMVVQMLPSEGKTLANAIPAYLHALSGDGVQIHGSIDHLVARDAEAMGRLFNYFGLSVGAILDTNSNYTYTPDALSSKHKFRHLKQYKDRGGKKLKRQDIYRMDIVYAVKEQPVFDSMRDVLVRSRADMLLRPQAPSLVVLDEGDSTLFNDASDPLVLMEHDNKTELDFLANRFKRNIYRRSLGLIEGRDYILNQTNKTVQLNISSKAYVDINRPYIDFDYKRYPDIRAFYAEWIDPEGVGAHLLSQALRARHFFERGVDYIVADKQIIIIDEFTGRLKDDHAWSHGLHSMIAFKEGVNALPSYEVKGIHTYQNYYRNLNTSTTFAAISGTFSQMPDDFFETYNLPLVAIPPTYPSIVQRGAPVIHDDDATQMNAILQSVRDSIEAGRPTLIGVDSILSAVKLKNYFEAHGIDVRVVDGQDVDSEADIIDNSGNAGQVTIGTAIMGRGVHIELTEAIQDRGGLKVIKTYLSQTRAGAEQFYLRAGRQGQPGSAETHLSLEHASLAPYRQEITHSIDTPATLRWIQAKTSQALYSNWQKTLDYDDVLDSKRYVFARIRDRLWGPDNGMDYKIDRRNQVALAQIDKIVTSFLSGAFRLQGLEQANDYAADVQILFDKTIEAIAQLKKKNYDTAFVDSAFVDSALREYARSRMTVAVLDVDAPDILEAKIATEIYGLGKALLDTLSPNVKLTHPENLWDELYALAEPNDTEINQPLLNLSLTNDDEASDALLATRRLLLIMTILNDQSKILAEDAPTHLATVDNQILPLMREADYMSAYTLRTASQWSLTPTSFPTIHRLEVPFKQRLKEALSNVSVRMKAFRLALFGHHLRTDYSDSADKPDLEQIIKLSKAVIERIGELMNKEDANSRQETLELSKFLVNGINIDIDNVLKERNEFPRTLDWIESLVNKINIPDAVDILLYAYSFLEREGLLAEGNDSFLTTFQRKDFYTIELFQRLNDYNFRQPEGKKITMQQFVSDPKVAHDVMRYLSKQSNLDEATIERNLTRYRELHQAIRAK